LPEDRAAAARHTDLEIQGLCEELLTLAPAKGEPAAKPATGSPAQADIPGEATKRRSRTS